MALDCFALSEPGDPGGTNGDHAAVAAAAGILAVADGVSGRPGAAAASRVAATTFRERIEALPAEARLQEAQLRSAVEEANRAVRALGEANPDLAGLGTTLSAVVLAGRHGKVVHVGDSRVHVFRGGALEQLTADHTLVAELVARHHLSPAGARRHALRNLLTRSVGAESVSPDIVPLEVRPGDWLLLATDGLGKALDAAALTELIAAEPGDAERLCRRVVREALARAPGDDVTLITARLVEDGHGPRA